MTDMREATPLPAAGDRRRHPLPREERRARTTATATVAPAPRPRIAAIDLLRGLIMVLMALDHTRHFFEPAGVNVRDVADPALFMTRWITHFCAPLFILLAGTSAFLNGAQHGRAALARFLLTRGLWLIVIELTLLRVGWSFDLEFTFLVAQVIWAIGASMLALGALVFLPRLAIAAIALALIAGHNLFDGVKAAQLGAFGPLWTVLHQQGLLQPAPHVAVYVFYPLVPWIGVMAAGYALGPLFLAERTTRLRWLVGLGAALTIGFALLRLSNLYGDPVAWQTQPTLSATLLAFINCEKYPPSLLYLMMTIGPGLLALAAFESARGRVADFFVVFGRVPFFFYVTHIYLIHTLAVGFALMTTGDAGWLTGAGGRPPSDYGLALPAIYGMTALVVALLYPVCRWFAALKARRRDWWLSYL
jgi:uncharacterized membrane protein